MNRHRDQRRGKLLLELLLVLGMTALLLQLFPDVSMRFVESLDFRNWSRTFWFSANLAILLLLLGGCFGPALVDSWRQRWHATAATRSGGGPLTRPRPNEDVRVEMRRDEALRTKLQQKYLLYCLTVPAAVVGMIAAVGTWNISQGKVSRAANEFLFENVGADFHRDVTGVVGAQFRVRPDRDLLVTQLGVYDNRGDGLQYDYHVGLFCSSGGDSKSACLVAEVVIPYGRHAMLERAFRWVELPQPISLDAGSEYILAAESFGGWLGRGADDEEHYADSWPSTVDEVSLRKQDHSHAWNPSVIGSAGAESRSLLYTEKPWPAVPDSAMPTQGIAHGNANMIALEVEREKQSPK